MRRIAVVLVMLVFAGPVTAGFLPPGVLAMTGAPWTAWKAETVDPGLVFPTQVGLALDSGGEPHVTYTADTGASRSAWYARRVGALWERTVIEGRVGTGVFAGDVAIDSQDRAHVVFTGGEDGSGTTLRYGVWNGNSFTKETVEVTEGGFIQRSRISFDAWDRPHISYELFGPVMKYATKVNGIWTVETIDTHQVLTHAMAVDPEGRVHVVYSSDDPGDAMRYATRGLAGAWTITILQGCTDEPGIDVDSAGRPHISCHSAVDGLVYFRHDGTQWLREVLDDGEFWRPFWQRGFRTDLALDSHDRPHIAYRDRFDPLDRFTVLFQSHMEYATNVDGAWVFEKVDAIGQGNGFEPTIEIDSEDRPRASYILGWLAGFADPSPANPYFDLKYAEPAAAVLNAAGQ